MSGICLPLQESRSIAKRKAEEVAEAQVHRTHKQLKQELKTRGRVKVSPRGQDPEHDLREKGLMRVANRCAEGGLAV